jgi:hypothetical protein
MHGRLDPALDGDRLVAVAAGPTGEAAALWSAPADWDALFGRAHRGLSARSRPVRPVPVRVTTHRSTLDNVVRIAELDLAFCAVQPLPDGAVLIVGARRRQGGHNAVQFDSAGTPVRKGDLRDGIQHMLTTPTGQVWVGYFDEGVYGDDPVAHHGIVRFSDQLEPDWTYPFDIGFGPVDDCYALNVDGETAWSCYYNAFPLVHIDADANQVTGWRNNHAGASTMLVDQRVCGLVGGYGRDHARIVVGQLGDGALVPLRELVLTLPDGQPLPSDARFTGRGPDLHAFVGTRWYRLGLDDIA